MQIYILKAILNYTSIKESVHKSFINTGSINFPIDMRKKHKINVLEIDIYVKFLANYSFPSPKILKNRITDRIRYKGICSSLQALGKH